MAEKHYHEQVAFARSYVMPYLKKHVIDFDGLKVLEVGCAEAGLLAELKTAGCRVTGVELSADRCRLAAEFNEDLTVLQGDITDDQIVGRLDGPYDLVVLRDVIEHVPDRQAAFRNLYQLVKPQGWLYITFPPRFSPFAGHQQIGRSPLKRVPWLQFWPPALLKLMARKLNEYEHMADFILENGRIGLSIRRFHRYRREAGFAVGHVDCFLSRPIYNQRFGWPIIRIPAVPLLGEAFSTGCESLLRKPV